jgi:hypothetical protein
LTVPGQYPSRNWCLIKDLQCDQKGPIRKSLAYAKESVIESLVFSAWSSTLRRAPAEGHVRRHHCNAVHRLLQVDQVFRSAKAMIETCPIDHRTNPAICGYVFFDIARL